MTLASDFSIFCSENVISMCIIIYIIPMYAQTLLNHRTFVVVRGDR